MAEGANQAGQLSILRSAYDRLRDAGVPDWRASAEWLVTDVLERNLTRILLNPATAVEDHAVRKLDAFLERRIGREPVQYIVGYTEFMGLRIAVNADVLVPRPETEQLVENVVRNIDAPAPRILDIGTGSGCIAIALKHFVGQATVTACDLSASALALAALNAKTLGVDVKFVLADALAAGFSDRFEAPFDVIVSNPPYLPTEEKDDLEPEVLDHEPHLALFVDGDALRFYRNIAGSARRLLKSDGLIAFEVHVDAAGAVADLLRIYGFVDVMIERDYADMERIVRGRFRPA